jgi:arylsulfatase A-like enzyme
MGQSKFDKLQLDRRGFLKTTSALAAGAMCSSSLFGAGGPDLSKHNVLFVMTDQQRFDALSCMGNKFLHTPNIDRLANEGITFQNTTTCSPLCGPSRAAMLTGKYIHGHNYAKNGSIKGNRALSKNLKTRDEIMSENGYVSKYFGKWHTGPSHIDTYEGGLTHYTDDYHQFLLSKYGARTLNVGEKKDRYTHWPYQPSKVDQFMTRAERKSGVRSAHHHEAGLVDIDPEDSLTAWTINSCAEYIDNYDSDKPFNITCSILAPHSPLILSNKWYSKFDPKDMVLPGNLVDDYDLRNGQQRAIPRVIPYGENGVKQFIALYYGLIAEVDHHLGKLWKSLERKGVLENTIIVFVSDHGEMMGSHRMFSKGVFFEEALRVPLIIRLPGAKSARRVVESPFSTADLVPTLLGLSGIKPKSDMHGRDVSRELMSERPIDLKYSYSDLGTGNKRSRSIRTNDWKLVFEQNRSFLYNLKRDPGETENVLPRKRRIAIELKTKMLEFLEQTSEPRIDKVKNHKL